MNTAIARRRLERMIAVDSAPKLTEEEVDDLLLMSARPDDDSHEVEPYKPWRADAEFLLGDKVIPTASNGHYYVVTSAGSAAPDEPAWPVSAAGTVTNGTVVFAEAGVTHWNPSYDLNAGASEGWRWKAGKVAHYFDFSLDGSSMSKSQILAHCTAQAEYYASKASNSGLGTIRIQSDLGLGYLKNDIVGNVNAG